MFGVNSVGILTDLASDEVLAKERQPVTADDVLALHEAIADGSFTII